MISRVKFLISIIIKDNQGHEIRRKTAGSY